MRISVVISLWLVILPLTLTAQDQIPGARTASLGYSTYAIPSTWSMFDNQAGLAWQKDFWVGVHHENKFFVKNLGFSAIGGNIPVKPGTFGIGLTHFGYNQFNQTKLGVSYGMMLSKNFGAGIGLNYHNVSLSSSYGSTSTISVEGGINYQPSAKLMIGAHAFNPTGSKLGVVDDLPITFGIGIAYKPFKQILLSIQGDDNSISSPVFRCGIEYNPMKSFGIRAGFASNPTVVSFGLGYEFIGLDFDLAFSYHEILGYTPHISVSYLFGKRLEP